MRSTKIARRVFSYGSALLMVVLSTSPLAAEANRPNGEVDPDRLAQMTPAQRGYYWLLNKPYFQQEFDQELFDNLWQVWEEPQRTEAEKATPDQRRQMAFSRYGFMATSDRDGTLPLQYVPTGESGWVVNCFSCHGGKVAGRVIPGLPNTHIVLETFQEDLAKTRKLLGRTDARPDDGLDGAPLGGSVGTTNAVVFGVILGRKRDMLLNYRPDSPLPPPQLLHHDHDAPPWWHVKRKNYLYADGFAPKAHRALMPFLLLPQTGPEHFAKWESDFRDILAYLESIEPPKYPWTIEQPLADKGKIAFERNCAECHGTYGPDGQYPEKIVALDEVGTDPLRLRSLTKLSRLGHQLSWFGEHGKHKTITDPGGYVAPPLDGIWASAPYLHNGAIPTLHHLFYPEERPVVWSRTEDGYDQQRVGLEITTYEDVPAEAVAIPAQRRRYFDTRIPGKSRDGHLFPETLTDDEKKAVLEYLKTL